MLLKFFRYSHFIMAVLSSLFILLTSLTGLILSFEPIHREINFAQSNADDVSVSQLLTHLTQYDEILEIKIDEYGHTIASLSHGDMDGDFYINPVDGKIIQEVPEQKWIFSFATNLHRSLFLKTTGRIIVAIVSLFLLLLAITGGFLVVKRLHGLNNIFNKINKGNIRVADYHTFLGRIQFIPIIIITVTGILLSLIRFDIIESKQKDVIDISDVVENSKKEISEIPIFKNTNLSIVNAIEFPFSDDEEDYYYLTISGVKKTVHQYTGQIIEEEPAISTYTLKSLSTLLHTGKGSVIWSVVLGMVCLGIFYFIYSGFVISYKRLSTSVKNKVSADDAEYILLYGSENGQTKKYANQFLKALQKEGLSVFMLPLNEYRYFPSSKELIIMTATYGDGEAPSNAKNFLTKFQDTNHKQELRYSVLGFGSYAYKLFCQYAKDVTAIMEAHHMMEQTVETHFVNNSNFNDYKNWARVWGDSHKLTITLEPPKQKLPKQTAFTIVKRNVVETEYEKTITIRLKPNTKSKYVSGDLLAIYPEEDLLKRQYSIGKIDNDILLSVKVHDQGICSQYLASLKVGDILKGKIEKNRAFHFLKNREVIMISNGTGIAPFLGMIHNQSEYKKILFWGGRNQAGYKLYQSEVETALGNGTLSQFHIAYSREGNKQYVQALIAENINTIVDCLANEGIIMICGSVGMQTEVFHVIDQKLAEKEMDSVDFFKFKGQILTDCY